LNDLNEAAGIAGRVVGIEGSAVKREVADAMMKIWKIRDKLYAIDPQAKPDFVALSESNPAECDAMFGKLDAAHAAEKQGSVELARRLYRELRSESRIEFFKVHAEAGLFRIQSRETAD